MFALTAAGTIAFDLVTAVQLGVAVAVVLAVVSMARTARAVPEPVDTAEIDSETEHELLTRHVLVCRLDGPLFFAAAARFLAQLTAVADVRVVILRLGSVAMLDATRTGTVVTAIQGRDYARIYVKDLDRGRSPVALSPEEQEAVERAMSR